MARGLMTTYDLTTGVQLMVEDMISVLSPFDVPLLGQQGADGRTVLSQEPIYEKKVEWLDETLLTPRTTVGANGVTADTYITTASGERERFQTGDVIRVNAEYMRITDYGSTADSLVVTRAYSGTAASFTAGDEMIGVGSALPEGTDPPAARTRDRVNRYNLTEIFGPYKVHVSESEQVVRKYGLQMTEFDKQVANRVKEAYVAMEQAIMYGTRVDDTTNKWRTMGGMVFYITSNVDSTTTDITEAKLLDQLSTVFNNGGNPDRIIVGGYQKRKISQLTDNSLMRVVQATDSRGRVVNSYESDFGELSIILDRWVKKSDLFIISRDQATVGTLRPLTFEMLAKTGDSEVGQVVGEKTLVFRREAQAARFNALT